jgi:hypothetical protein
MRNLFIITFFVCLSGWTPSWAQQNTVESRMSPKLRQFLKSHPAALSMLTSSISEVFSHRTVSLVYFYSDNNSEAPAYHYYPNTFGLPEVVICVRENVQPLDEFVDLYFETLNSRGETRFAVIQDKVRAGKISKDDFVRELLRVEFDAIKDARDSLLMLKFSRKEISRSHGYRQFAECPSEFEEFISYTKRLNKGKRDLLMEYGEQYDSLRQWQQSPPTSPQGTRSQ